jgi:hypothetical protein
MAALISMLTGFFSMLGNLLGGQIDFSKLFG